MIYSLHDIFLGRQPILDRNQHIVAYELLFRDGDGNHASVRDDMNASAQVIIRAFSESDIHDVLGGKKGFINVNAELLLSDLIELLPRDKVVIELPETIQVGEPVIDRCRALKAMGFSLAIGDFNGGAHVEPLYEFIDVIKLDLSRIPPEELAKHVSYLKRWPLKLLAEKVEYIEQAKQCIGLGFDLFQGYYYARPVVLGGKRADSSRLALLKLIELILVDAETAELEQVFKREPSLSFNLLRMINSVAMGLDYKIASLRQAIVVLGQQQLQRWLQLLLFVNPDGGLGDSPLLELAATRGKLMELLAAARIPKDKDFMERAFMVGIMSLLDTLLGMTIQDVVNQVNLADDIEDALLNKGGRLGKLLLIVQKAEQNDLDAVTVLLADMRISQTDLMHAQLEAMRWANALKEVAAE